MPSVIERNALLRPRRQKYRRLKYAVDVEVLADLMCERGRSHDLSASGVFVDAAQDYLAGMTVTLRFQVHGRDFETRAEIIHVKPQIGFGAMFLDLDDEERRCLIAFVHRERATREAERLIHGDV